jgi:uncharacterized protein (UPF0371 family)
VQVNNLQQSVGCCAVVVTRCRGLSQSLRSFEARLRDKFGVQVLFHDHIEGYPGETTVSLCQL